MNSRTFLCTPVLLASLASPGCFLGEPALYGKAFEEYQQSIKPYVQYWEKPGVTSQARREDARQCGTAGTDHAMEHVVFDKTTLMAARAEGETSDAGARTRLLYRWERCMLDKGYTFVGQCPDNEISRAKLACRDKFRQ